MPTLDAASKNRCVPALNRASKREAGDGATDRHPVDVSLAMGNVEKERSGFAPFLIFQA